MFNPIVASENIKESFVDYITTSFDFQDETYARELREELNKPGMIAKGPYIELSGSYETTKSIHQLITEGVASPLFDQLEPCPEKDKEIPLDRPLYAHQVKALERAMEHKNLVVTTGTGSGKTECFLIPIVNSLLQEVEAGTLSNAVRAIVIYPMNALANDQIKRMRALLKGYPQIRFGLYNGNTKHSETEARSQYHRMHGADSNPLENEVISREAMQKTPPHILITNYSMLEYMMLRPKDDAVFSGAQLRYIVLDEAHIYKGATGMETALLMRRLKARISAPKNVQYILTSATLGDKESNGDIIAFAERLCGERFEADNIIRSIERNPEMKSLDDFPMKPFHMIASNQFTPGEILRNYDMDYALDASDDEKLFEVCLHSKLFHEIRVLIQKNGPMTVNALYNALSKENNLQEQRELIDFIDVCSRAEKDKVSLVKVRYHFFVRALEGAYITLTDPKELFLQRKKTLTVNDQDIAVFECAICSHCGRTAVVGKTQGDRDEQFLQQVSQWEKGQEYYILKENESENLSDEDEEESDEQMAGENDYALCPICARIAPVANVQLEGLCEHDSSKYLYVTKCENPKNADTGSVKCLACGFGRLRKFYLGSEAATAVLGTELYEQLPEKEQRVIEPEKRAASSGIFGKKQVQTTQMVAKARQFLCFSDSRSEAAFFACYMEKSYDEFLRRRGIWHVADEMKAEGRTCIQVKDFVRRLASYFESCDSFRTWDAKPEESFADVCIRNAWIAVLNEMFNARRSSSLASMGVLSFEFAKNDDEDMLNSVGETYNASPVDIKQLLNLIVLDAVYSGVLTAKEAHLTQADREYIFFTPVEKTLKLVKTAEDSGKSQIIGWAARQRSNGNYYYSARLERTKSILNVSAEDANAFLEAYWCEILGNNREDDYAFEAADFRIRLNGDPKLQFYRCKKCGKVTAHNCQNRCASVKCSGMLEEYDPSVKLTANHYAKLYQSEQMKPLYIKEHTAQLSRQQQTVYQEAFVNKKINALSCSTTFEMGVDVGSLETVYMRDVPPSPANYVQRAGRAGRARHSAAFVLTYAKLSSHDFTFYQHPTDMISGKIKAPIFEIENKKVVYRHIYAVALADFFAVHPEVYNHNNATVFLNGDGYQKLKDFLTRKPSHLLELLQKSIPQALHNSMGIDTWEWTEHLIGENGVLEIAVTDFQNTVLEYQKQLDRFRRLKDDKGASDCSFQLRAYRMADEDHTGQRKIIDFLVRSNVLPKYGFPVDTAEMMTQLSTSGNDNSLQLVRDLQMAIAEYAPGSQVIADGKMYTSRYIRKLPKSTSWENGFFCQCPDCQQPNFTKLLSTAGKECVSCHTLIKKRNWHKTLEPRLGFIAESDPKPVPMKRPEREYKSDDYYVGDTSCNIINKQLFESNGQKVEVESTTNDTLVVVVSTDYMICPICGYATEGSALFKIPHHTAAGYKCSLKEKPKEQYYLSHDFKTDVVKLTFMTLAAGDYTQMLSVMYALLEGVSRQLGIERTDIKGTLFSEDKEGYRVFSVILYDAVAGGAGHVRRLVTDDGKVLNSVIEKAIEVCDSCDCDGSCYKCLRNYYNQKIHHLLDRSVAAAFLKQWRNLAVATNTESSADVLDTNNSEQRSSTCQKGSRALVIPEYPEYDRMTSSEALAELADPGNGLSEETNEKLQRIIDTIAEDDEKIACMDIEIPLNNGESVRPDIIWPQQKVALFTEAGQYEQLSEYDWTSFLLDEHFVPEELFQCINEKE